MFRIIGHIGLSALLLLSATGLTVNMHYCHDKLVNLAFMGPAHSCCTIPGDDSDFSQGMEKPDHCDDQSLHFEATSDFVVSAGSFNLDIKPPLNLLFSSAIILKQRLADEISSGRLFNFKIPQTVPEVDLPKIQTFLI